MSANRYQDDQVTRLALAEQSVDNLNKSLNRIENSIYELRSDMNKGFSDINNRLWRNFYFMVGGFASVLAMIAHVLKWI